MENPNAYWYPYYPCRNAEKERRRFSAVDPEELLGLVVMWEIRGNDWFLKENENAFVDKVYDNTLFMDEEGTIIVPEGY